MDAMMYTEHLPSPARVLGLAVMAGQILQDLDARIPESLSTAEADLLACLSDCRDDLETIAEQARAELGPAWNRNFETVVLG
jgi:hypothetical protein